MFDINKKIDYHVHIGQWSNVYYSPESVLDALKASEVEEVWFSSTSSCRYCKESFDVKTKNIDISDLPTALELYDFIKYEVLDTIEYGKKIGLKTIPLYWVIPELFSGVRTYISFYLHTAVLHLPDLCKIHRHGQPLYPGKFPGMKTLLQ